MAIQATPPKTAEILDIQQSWYKFLSKLNTQFGDTGLSKTLFVDRLEGDDTKAVRGSIAFKYATIQAALDAALAGDVVLVSPGTYTERLDWPNTNNLTLMGCGRATVITSAVANSTIEVAPTFNQVVIGSIRSLDINNTSGTNAALTVNGTSDLNLKFNLDDVQIHTTYTTSAVYNTVGISSLNEVTCDHDFEFYQISTIYGNELRLSETAGDILVDTDPAGDMPNDRFGALILNSSICHNLDVVDIGKFAGSDDCLIAGNIVGTLTDFDAPLNTTGTIMMSGRVLGNIAVTHTFATELSQIPLILDQARISGNLGMAGAGAQSATCRALNAIFYNTAGVISAGNNTIVDIRGSQFAQAMLAVVGNGTIDRTDWYETLALGADIDPSLEIPITIPYPAYVNDNYTVVVEAADILDAAAGFAISLKDPDSFNLAGTNGGGATTAGAIRWHILRPYHG